MNLSVMKTITNSNVYYSNVDLVRINTRNDEPWTKKSGPGNVILNKFDCYNTIFDRDEGTVNHVSDTKLDSNNINQKRQLKKKKSTIIDVLVIVSNRAMCEYAGIIELRTIVY
jgi:hypothetical protein